MKIKFILLFPAIFLVPMFASAVEVKKPDWFSGMETVLPTAFCNKEQYFRQCFSVTARECEETIAAATRVCLNKNDKDIPDILVQPKDGTHWGQVIGQCAGIAYEITLASKRINNAKCSDASNWLPER